MVVVGIFVHGHPVVLDLILQSGVLEKRPSFLMNVGSDGVTGLVFSSVLMLFFLDFAVFFFTRSLDAPVL